MFPDPFSQNGRRGDPTGSVTLLGVDHPFLFYEPLELSIMGSERPSGFGHPVGNPI